MSVQKEIKIDFYRFRVAQGSSLKFSELLESFLTDGKVNGPFWESVNHCYELKNINKSSTGVIKAEFCKLRLDNLPMKSAPGGEEEKLDLAENEGLLEKNYLMYWPADNVMAYQVNGHGSVTSALASYISEQAGETATFDILLDKTSLSRLMRKDVQPLSLEVDFATPDDPSFYSSKDFSPRMMQLLSSTGADTASFKISIDGRKSKVQRFLETNVKDIAKAFHDDENTKKTRVTVANDMGQKEVIDLMADRIRAVQMVRMNGKYPRSGEMYDALRSAYNEKKNAIYDVIGRPGDRLTD